MKEILKNLKSNKNNLITNFSNVKLLNLSRFLIKISRIFGNIKLNVMNTEEQPYLKASDSGRLYVDVTEYLQQPGVKKIFRDIQNSHVYKQIVADRDANRPVVQEKTTTTTLKAPKARP